MRRTLLTLTLALLVLAVMPGVVAAKKGGGSQDSVQGSGTYAFGCCVFEIDASSDPLGGNPTGTFHFEGNGQDFSGVVECLNVVGNQATISGTVTEQSGLNPPLENVVFTVVDNSPGTPAPDLVSTVSRTPVVNCATPVLLFLSPVETGDLTVTDATCDKFKDKPGTDKDKCKP